MAFQEDSPRPYSVTHDDWSLQRKGKVDQERHMEKVKESLRDNKKDLIRNPEIIKHTGNGQVRIPIPQLDQPKFRFDPSDKRGVGQGQGDTKVGDVLERYGHGHGPGDKAGSEPGDINFEMEMPYQDIEAILFEEWELPYLEEKQQSNISSPTIDFTEIRRTGAWSNLDKRHTMRANMVRNAKTTGRAFFGNIHQDDLRFRSWEEENRPESNAAVIAMMDISSSMKDKKDMARVYFHWVQKFLETKYDNVDMAYIVHHTNAREVEEEEFYTLIESGGTKISTAFEKALEVIDERYSPENYNVYPIYFSDGENYGGDNEICESLIDALSAKSSAIGYTEANKKESPSDLYNITNRMKAQHVIPNHVHSQDDIYGALSNFFSQKTE